MIGQLVTDAIPMTSGSIAVVTYTLGMAVFTIIMGNAFAAFPVMTAGIGLPLIVGRFGAHARVTEGENVEAAVDTRSLHFFDPETGLGIYNGTPPKGAVS